MQNSCQPVKNAHLDRYLPSCLIFSLCPIVLFMPRYSVIIFSIAVAWSIYYLKNNLKRTDIQKIISRQINPTSQFEKYLNYGFLFLTLFDYFRPYGSWIIEVKIYSLLAGGFFWWTAINHVQKTRFQQNNSPLKKSGILNISTLNKTLNHLVNNPLGYGIILCCICILVDYCCGDILVSNALKIGKNRPLIFAKISMTLSTSVWLALYNQPFWKVLLSVVALLILMPLLECDTAIVCLILGLASYYLASIQSKIFWRIIQVNIVCFCMLLPFLFSAFLTDANIYKINKIMPTYSYIHRLYIWKHVADKIQERPVIGFGLDAALQKDVGGGDLSKPFYWSFENGQGVNPEPITGQQIPNHPHNLILQWWLEGGFVNALWWSALLVFIIEKIRKRSLLERRVCLAFFTSNMLIPLFSIGLWQSWWWGTWLFLLPLLSNSKK